MSDVYENQTGTCVRCHTYSDRQINVWLYVFSNSFDITERIDIGLNVMGHLLGLLYELVFTSLF